MGHAAAVAFAGLEKFIALDVIKAHETVLINCSGHTFPAEKHILEDQYVLELELGNSVPQQSEGLDAALERLDEQVKTVVVIDDNPSDSRLIRRLLQASKNYRVFEANNPIDGLALIRQRRPDLVITDLNMPDIDGFAVLDKLKVDPETAHIPLIVISGLSLTQAERERLEGRIESVWLKGNFETRTLVEHVVSTLNDQPSSKTLANEENPTELPARKILVVDDNPYDSRLVRRILEAEKKFEVKDACSGEGAFKVIENWQPDLIILDIMLPDMSGFDVLKRLRNSAALSTIQVAVLSARDLSSAEREQLNNAVFWHKAVLDQRTLVEAVEQQLRSSRMERSSNTPTQ